MNKECAFSREVIILFLELIQEKKERLKFQYQCMRSENDALGKAVIDARMVELDYFTRLFNAFINKT